MVSQVLDVNLKACFLLAQAAGNHFLSFDAPPIDITNDAPSNDTYGRGGKIINFCSLLSYQGGFTVRSLPSLLPLPFILLNSHLTWCLFIVFI